MNSVIFSPLEQFEILPIFSFILGENFAFTNSSFFLVVIVATILSFLYFGCLHRPMILPNRWQAGVESLYVNSLR